MTQHTVNQFVDQQPLRQMTETALDPWFCHWNVFSKNIQGQIQTHSHSFAYRVFQLSFHTQFSFIEDTVP